MFDYLNTFSVDQDLSQEAGAYNSTVLDLGVPGTIKGVTDATALQRIGLGAHPIYYEVRVTEAFTATGAATLRVQLVNSAATNLGTPTVIADTGVLAKSVLTLGARLLRGSLLGIPLALRYLGIIYTIADDTTATGKCTAGLLATLQTNPPHAT